MGVDGALFDVSKIDNICKDRLSKMTKEEISSEILAWADQYDKDLYEIINRDYNYFKEIMNIEREIEKPRKDYTKYSDIKETILFFYEDKYQELLNNAELPFNPNISKEDTVNVLKTFLKENNTELNEQDWFNNLKEIGNVSKYPVSIESIQNCNS